MKRITPRTIPGDDAQYPSVVDLTLADAVRSRRTFLRGAAAAGAGLAGALLAPTDSAAGGRSPRRYKATLHVGSYTFRYGNYRLQRAVAQTTSQPLARFLGDPRERKGIARAIRHLLNKHTCADLQNGKRLAAMQRAVGRTLASHYRRRTRRTVTPPTVVLFVGVPGTNCAGDCPAPVPICKPPTP